MNICVYGDFSKKDIRIKVFYNGDMEQYIFQNILRDAGYDVQIHNVPELDELEHEDYENV